VAAGRPAKLWSVRMGGPVRHPPTATTDTVFAADSTGRLTAVDATEGRPRWTVQLPGAPSGQPRTSADVVYVGTGAGLVCGFDARTGEARWQVAAPAHTGTPTADAAGNLLLTTFQAWSRQTLASVDPRTGQQRWTHEFQTPFVPEVTVAGDAVLVHHQKGACVRLDTSTGQVDWSKEWGSQYTGHSPVTEHRGVVYAGSGDGDLYGLDLDDGSILGGIPAIRTDLAAQEHPGDIFYSQPRMRYAPSVEAAPLVIGESVVIVQRNGRISCHPLDLGRQRWAEYTVPPLDAALTTASGLVVTIAGHRVHARDVSTGTVVWRARIGSAFGTGSYPTGAGRAIYLGVGRQLRAYDAEPAR
jgi:outer membrane protein assembly factor BamB